MTPEQAINFLDTIASQVSMPRKDHEAAVQAIIVLKQLVADSAPAPAPPSTD